MMTPDYEKISNSVKGMNNLKLVKKIHEIVCRYDARIILELGCGFSLDSEKLKQMKKLCVFGVDKSMSMLTKHVTNVSKINADVDSLPIKSKSIDLIFLSNLLHLLEDKGARCFTEANRVLSKNGVIFLPITTHEEIKSRYLNKFFPSLEKIEIERYPKTYFLSNSLQGAGFCVVETGKIRYGQVVVDMGYYNKLKTGWFSGMNLLPERELEFGMEKLLEQIKISENTNETLSFDWNRTYLIGEKVY